MNTLVISGIANTLKLKKSLLEDYHQQRSQVDKRQFVEGQSTVTGNGLASLASYQLNEKYAKQKFDEEKTAQLDLIDSEIEKLEADIAYLEPKLAALEPAIAAAELELKEKIEAVNDAKKSLYLAFNAFIECQKKYTALFFNYGYFSQTLRIANRFKVPTLRYYREGRINVSNS